MFTTMQFMVGVDLLCPKPVFLRYSVTARGANETCNDMSWMKYIQ